MNIQEPNEEINENNNENTNNQRAITHIITLCLTVCIMYILSMTIFDFGHVDGISMEPTFNDKDIEIAIYIKNKEFKRGDIVNIDSVALERSIVKRIIGLEGDVICIENGKFYLNNKEFKEDYIQDDVDYSKHNGLFVIVPKGYIFVMGDNREESNDSRNFGCICKTEVRSKVLITFK